MVEKLLRPLAESPRRLGIVIIGSFVIGLVILLPIVDEYSELKTQKSVVAKELATAKSVLGGLEDFEKKVHHRVDQIKQFEKRAVSGEQMSEFRGRMVQLIREAGCRIHRIHVGRSQSRAWVEEDNPLSKVFDKRKNLTGYQLETHPFSMSISGSQRAVHELLTNLHEQQNLSHMVKFSIRPYGGKRKEVTLDLEMWLFELVKPDKVST